jgi:hypothetical protein
MADSDDIPIQSGDGSAHTDQTTIIAPSHSPSNKEEVKESDKKSHSSSSHNEEEVKPTTSKPSPDGEGKGKSKKEKSGPSPLALATLEQLRQIIKSNGDIDSTLAELEENWIPFMTKLEKEAARKPKDHPPKRNAYQLFMEEEKDNEKLKGVAQKERMGILGPMWKKLEKSEKKDDKRRVARLKEQAKEELAAYEAWAATHKSDLTIRPTKIEGLPKPHTAKGGWKIQMREVQKEKLRKKHGIEKGKRLPEEVTKKLNAKLDEMWAKLDEKEKKKLEKEAKREMEEWEEKLKHYVPPKKAKKSKVEVNWEMSD